MRNASLALLLLLAASAHASPWPVRAARNLGHNARLAAVDCVRSARMRAECGAIIAATTFDFATTREFERYYPAIHELNPLFGPRAATWRMSLVGGAETFGFLDAIDYIKRNEPPRRPWELIDVAVLSGLHGYAGAHNLNTIAACQKDGVCR